MRPSRRIKALAASTLSLIVVLSFLAVPSVSAAPSPGAGRYILVAKTAAETNALATDARAAGVTVTGTIPDVGGVVATASAAALGRLTGDGHLKTIARDRVNSLTPPEGQSATPASKPGRLSPKATIDFAKLSAPLKQALPKGVPSLTGDPAMSLPGLMWNVNRINGPQAWALTTGSNAVTVGVADTGLDYTHPELASRVTYVADFTYLEGSPTICEQIYGPGYTDANWAAEFGAPSANLDFNGHGSWIGGNIAAALDGVGINGIVPNVKLVSLKISQWCGTDYDSEIIAAFLWAAQHGIDVVSISFGGYLDLTDPQQVATFNLYQQAVALARTRGTVIVAAAGNEHVRIGALGQVISHGPLTAPGDAFQDYYGLYENPGGIPGVVDVASTGNVVNAPSGSCPPNFNGTSVTCKLTSDAHQPPGVGTQNQLAYYSNYGPRIDIAAPGGARKFNLPVWDAGGTPGFPVTSDDGLAAFEDFSITSNWAVEIPCYTFFDAYPYLYDNACYSTIQGTSMATPHVSAVIALMASRSVVVRHKPDLLVYLLKSSAQHVTGNTTQPLSPNDYSGGDLYGAACPTGYCHLGGPAISDSDAYGAGLVDAYAAVLAAGGGH